jgi:excisionase family DNA binding protein
LAAITLVGAVTELESSNVEDSDGGVMLALREAATRLGVSGAKVRQWVKAGKLHARRFGGELYIPAFEVDALRRQVSASDAAA